MAEFVMKDLVKREGLEGEFSIASCATSREEIGNGVHPGTKRKLREVNISCDGKYAVQLTKQDYETYDYLLAMEQYNITNMKRIIGDDRDHKVYRLLDFSDRKRDIADPWYTGNFDVTYQDIVEGCQAFLAYVREQGQCK